MLLKKTANSKSGSFDEVLELELNLRGESGADMEECEIPCLKKDKEIAGYQC